MAYCKLRLERSAGFAANVRVLKERERSSSSGVADYALRCDYETLRRSVPRDRERMPLEQKAAIEVTPVRPISDARGYADDLTPRSSRFLTRFCIFRSLYSE